MIRIPVAIATTLLLGSAPAPKGSTASCMAAPPFQAIRIPTTGFVQLDWQEPESPCFPSLGGAWLHAPAGSFEVFVRADGPEGSGRYWEVVVGAASPGASAPDRGVCLPATTLGWRSLQSFSELPLPWLADRDGDGRPEILIWDSFPLVDEASMPETGLVAWVYALEPDGLFGFDEAASRRLAEKLAESYREQLPREDPWLREIRDRAASALLDLATGTCHIDRDRTMAETR